MPITNIDDLLMGGKTPTQPASPENHYQDGPEEIEEMEPETPDNEEGGEEDEQETGFEQIGDKPDDDEHEHQRKEPETDEYGNSKEPDNEVIRERLARQARKHEAEINALRAQLAQQNAAPAVQQAAKDFEYDPNASGNWQQQLASFVKQTVEHMTVEKHEHERQQQEQQHYQEFQSKFRQGMERFDDFIEVVAEKPLDDAMTAALRGVSDPAAFIYAAAKRNPEELERISKLRDPHARYAEMIRLEERMRRNKPMTKAPRPIARTPGDSGLPAAKSKSSKEPSIEDLIAKSDAKRLANMKGRGGSRR